MGEKEVAKFWADGFFSVFWNIIGGILVAILTACSLWLYRKWHRKWQSRKFKEVFGFDTDGGMTVKYTAYVLPQTTVFPKPPSRVRRSTDSGINITEVTTEADMRATAYLANAFGKTMGIIPQIEPDHFADDRMDISFVSIGGDTNCRSRDCFDDIGCLVKFDGSRIVEKGTACAIVTLDASGVDYGLIVKLHPANNPARTWICCAGFNVWGTSGAAWFLSRHWMKIHHYAKNKPFVCITKTRIRSDDSTTLVKRFINRSGQLEEVT